MNPKPNEGTVTELKPCPFCGNKKIQVSHGMTGAPFLFFKCKECGATVSFDNDLSNRVPDLACANWNHRIPT